MSAKNYPENFVYTDQHEWASAEGNTVRMGITDYAQISLGDVVFVDLPKIGQSCKKGEPFCSIESVKAVSDIYAPVTGTVKEVNLALSSSPELVNSDAHGDGWVAVIEATDIGELSTLMKSGDYSELIAKISK